MGAYKTLAWERLSGQALYNEVRRFVTIHKFEPDDDAEEARRVELSADVRLPIS